jgi:hypothetical protein
MVYVRLARDWTDATGAAHAAGDMVDVDAVTLAELEATGVVTPSGNGASGGGEAVGKGAGAQWAGPTGEGGSAQWAGPTGGGGV